MRLPFRFSAGALASSFADAVRRGEIFGNRCPSCGRLYVPPRAFCSPCWRACEGWERVADTGTVTTFVIVNVPFYGQQVRIPYVLAHVRLDAADSTFLHLVGTMRDEELQPADVEIGSQVRAVWRPEERRTGFLNEDVDHFEPA
jgi:uncharacterized OB-fold protein